MGVGASRKWDLQVQCLTNAATLPVNASMTCEELRQAIQEHLGIDPAYQVWHADGKRLKLYNSQRLEDLAGTSLMTVLRCEPPLKPLPKRFALCFTSTRDRLFRTLYSSGFVIQYRLQADLTQGKLVFERWRKNDHDVVTFDSKKKEVKTEEGHSYFGSTFTKKRMKVDALVEFISHWHGHYLEPEQAHFWKSPSEGIIETQLDEDARYLAIDSDTPRALPDYEAVPGWFVAPDEDCQEIEMDLEIAGTHLVRMLVKNGDPLRVALSQGKTAEDLYLGLEEYEIQLQELASDQSLESDHWP